MQLAACFQGCRGRRLHASSRMHLVLRPWLAG